MEEVSEKNFIPARDGPVKSLEGMISIAEQLFGMYNIHIHTVSFLPSF